MQNVNFLKEIKRDKNNFHQVTCENLTKENFVSDLNENGFTVVELQDCHVLWVTKLSKNQVNFKIKNEKFQYSIDNIQNCYSINRKTFDSLDIMYKEYTNEKFKNHSNFAKEGRRGYSCQILEEKEDARIVYEGMKRPLGENEYLLEGNFYEFKKNSIGYKILLAYRNIDYRGEFDRAAKFYIIAADQILKWAYASNNQLLVDSNYQLCVNQI